MSVYRVSLSWSSLTQVSLKTASMNCAVSFRTVCALCFVPSFCLRTDDGRGIVIYCCIVFSHPRGFEECCAVARGVCCLRTNEADEVVHGSRFVVRDLKEERCHNLLDSCEVGVRWLPVDRLELLKRIGEFRNNLLRRHCVWGWRLFVVFGVKCCLRSLKE